MACGTAIEFIERQLSAERVRDKRVLEVGSLPGGDAIPRHAIEPLGPASYLGVDIFPGPNVDLVVDVLRLVERFGSDAFDVVVATELIEHTRAWRAAISNLKRVVAAGGFLIVTTRSRGYPFHAAPFDYWRYELDDMRAIFADMEIEALSSDPLYPGVFACLRKPRSFQETPTANIALFSILTGRRQVGVTDRDELRIKLGSPRRIVSTLLPARVRQTIWRLLPRPLARSLAMHRRPIPRGDGSAERT